MSMPGDETVEFVEDSTLWWTKNHTEIDNNVWFMDIFGSWVEAGMVLAALGVGMAFVFSAVYKKFWSKKEDPKIPNASFWSCHTRIHETLSELRVKTDCARVQLVQFHNTGHFLDGISMKKMSLTHESLANGVSSEMHIKKDLLLSMCIDGLNLLKKDDPKLYVTDSLEDSWCKQLLQTSNVVSFSFLPLRKHGQIMGYLMCQWCSWNKTDDVDESLLEDLIMESRKLVEVHLVQENRNKKNG